MSFVHPALLAAGLAAIAIPIIIHLLMNRRRKPVMWGAMRFLEEAFRRTRRRLLLEKWLLLATRCLLIALLAMAIARPLLGGLGVLGGSAGRTFFIVIDNSAAAQATDNAGRTALSRHIDAAREVISALRPLGGAVGGGSTGGDKVALITLAHPAEGVVLPASPDAGAVASLLDSLEPADSRADPAGAVALIAAALSANDDTKASTGAAYVVVLSDFLEGAADLGPGSAGGAAATIAGAKLPRGVTVLATEPAAEGVGNVAIVGVEPLRSVLVSGGMSDTPGAGEQVRVALRRTGPGTDAAAATVVRARIAPPDADAADTAESRAVVRWSPGQEVATLAVALPPTARTGTSGNTGSASTAAIITVSIDRDALDGDNTWRRPVEIRDALRVGIVAPTRFGRAGSVDRLDAASWIRLALAPRAGTADGGAVEIVTIEPASMDAARLAGLDAVFLSRPDLLPEGAWARVRLFIEGGGMAVVMPPPDATVHLWGDEMIRVLEPGIALVREARAVASAGAESDAARIVAPTSTTPEARDGAGDTAALLSLIEGELAELLRPVSVTRILPASAAHGAAMPGRTVLALHDGTPLLWMGNVGVREDTDNTAAQRSAPASSDGRGMLVYMAAALDLSWTDLPTKPLMVPLLNELVLQGVGRAKGSAWTVAGSRPFIGRRATELARIAASDSTTARTVRVDDAGVAGEPIRRAGVWQARDERGARRGVIAVNTDPEATRTGAQARDAVQAWLAGIVTADESAASTPRITWLPSAGAASTAAAGPTNVRAALAAAIGTSEQGSPISFPLLVAALALGLIEIVLARWASHASIVSVNSPRAIAPAVEAAA